MGPNGLTLARSVLVLFPLLHVHAILLIPCCSWPKQKSVGPAGLGWAGRPNKWPNFFEFFCVVLLNVVFQNSNMHWFKIKHAYAEMK